MVKDNGVINSISVVEAVLTDKQGKVLLLKRSKSNQFYIGLWQLPGGKVDFGEDIQKAIKREILEETGMKISKIKLNKVFSLTDMFDGEKNNVFLMIFEGDFLGKISLSKDHCEAKFFSIDEIKKLSLCDLSKKALFE